MISLHLGSSLPTSFTMRDYKFAALLGCVCGGWFGIAIDQHHASAGDRFRMRDRPVRETVDTRPENRLAPSPMLGTFQSTPVITVRGNGVIGGGYSPIGLYGENNAMTLFGPISSLRQTSAPVNTVVRGYNGMPTVVEGTSFSTPFQPDLSPVKYPTRASNYSSLRGRGVPTRAGNGIMWVDQN